MNHGTHIPHEEPPKHSEENVSESFAKWAKNQVPFIITQAISILLAIGTFTYYVIYGGDKVSKLISIEQAEYTMYFLNLGFCIFCIIKLLAIYRDNSMGEFTARKIYKRVYQTDITLGEHRKRLKQSMHLLSYFKLYFLGFWITLAALYMIFSVKPTSSQKNKKSESKLLREEKIIISSYRINDKDNVEHNTVRNVFYYATNEDTNLVKKKAKDTIIIRTPISKHQFENMIEALSKSWIRIVTYSLNTISVMFILWCFSVMAVRAQKLSDFRKKPLIIYLSLLFTVILVLIYPLGIGLLETNEEGYYYESLNNYSVLLNTISGVINAVIFALFIARLDSKFVSLPSKLIFLLYLYSAIQPLFLVFELPGYVNEAIKVSVLVSVFFLKIYFFFIIFYAIEKGKILSYLYCFSILNDRVESIVKNSYMIRPMIDESHRFTFNVYIGDFILFKSKSSYSNEDECKLAMKNLKSIASQRENYSIEREDDFWYIHFKDKNKKLHFSSFLSITSDKEGEATIEEAIHKIPYCKIMSR